MDELYQAEWCPYSRRVRQRFTELGVSFIARQVPADPADREELRRRTGSDEIPALVLEDGGVVNADADEIIDHIDAHYGERVDAPLHRERAEEHAGVTIPDRLVRDDRAIAVLDRVDGRRAAAS